jgi:LPXTG-site transpeptidase (sortase) family protein
MSKQNHNENHEKITGQHEMHEGQEVSLGIRPNHFQQPQAADEHHSSDAHIADRQTSPMHHVKEGHPQSPKINLHPKTSQTLQSRVSPFKPEKKRRRIRESIKTIRSHRHWHNAKLIVGTILVFVLIFNSQWFISQFMYLFNKPKATQTEQTTQTNQQTQTAQTQPQAEVVGPQNKIGVTAPLVFISTNNEVEVLKALQNGVVHYYGTALPGENGNAAFFGHSSNDWWEPGNYKFVFVLLEKLSAGDTYEIHYNSRKYVYQVVETKIVQPSDLSVLNQTSKPTSTLITCTPPGTSWRRFVVVANQIEPATLNDSSQTTNKPSVESAKLPSAPPSLWQQVQSFFSSIFWGNKSQNSSKEQGQPGINHLPEVN